MKPGTKRILRRIGGFIGVAVLVLWLVDRIAIGVPANRRVAELNGDITFELTPEFSPPYQFVVAVPVGSPSPLSFSGTIEIHEGTRLVASLPISSETSQSCSWLQAFPEVTGHIVTWNQPSKLGDIIRRDKTYKIRVTFSQPPPAGCSLWFASLHRVSLFRRNA